MLIVQLSDLHVRAPGKLLYRQIDTAGALAAAVSRINAMRPRPQRVVVSGDLTERGSDEEYAHLRHLLAALEIPYSLMPGNHDRRAALRAGFPEQGWQGDPLCCQRVDVDGPDPLCLLLLDTTVPGEDGGTTGAAQLAWLDVACPVATPCLLFLHHPPITTGIAGLDQIGFADAARLAQWLPTRPNVRLLAAGHVHRMLTGVFAGRPIVVAPSTVHQIAFDLSGQENATAWCREPGGMLVHRFDGEGFVTHYVPIAMAETVPYA